MEILLIITIIVVVIAYFNFKDYLLNPQNRPKINSTDSNNTSEIEEFKNYEDIYKTTSKEEKIARSWQGVLIALMAKVAGRDGRVCDLERELVENTIEDIATQITAQSATYQKEEILDILHKIFDETKADIETLTLEYVNLTKGQYKIRLKSVEYLLALAYTDGVLSDGEREVILDIAAYLEIENADFNRIYDEFSEFYARGTKELELSEAYKILGIAQDSSFDEVKKAYKNLVREYHPDILHHKGLDSSMVEKATKKLQEINSAYELIKESLKEKKDEE